MTSDQSDELSDTQKQVDNENIDGQSESYYSNAQQQVIKPKTPTLKELLK